MTLNSEPTEQSSTDFLSVIAQSRNLWRKASSFSRPHGCTCVTTVGGPAWAHPAQSGTKHTGLLLLAWSNKLLFNFSSSQSKLREVFSKGMKSRVKFMTVTSCKWWASRSHGALIHAACVALTGRWRNTHVAGQGLNPNPSLECTSPGGNNEHASASAAKPFLGLSLSPKNDSKKGYALPKAAQHHNTPAHGSRRSRWGRLCETAPFIAAVEESDRRPSQWVAPFAAAPIGCPRRRRAGGAELLALHGARGGGRSSGLGAPLTRGAGGEGEREPRRSPHSPRAPRVRRAGVPRTGEHGSGGQRVPLPLRAPADRLLGSGGSGDRRLSSPSGAAVRRGRFPSPRVSAVSPEGGWGRPAPPSARPLSALPCTCVAVRGAPAAPPQDLLPPSPFVRCSGCPRGSGAERRCALSLSC